MKPEAIALPRRSAHGRYATLIAGFAALLCATHASPARASALSDDAHRVENAWVGASFAVTRMSPRFLASGEAMPFVMPYTLDGGGCTTVGVLGTRTTDFTLQFGRQENGLAKPGDEEPDQTGRQSIAGSAMLVRCGASRGELRNLVVRMKSPQGAIEVLVADGPRPAPSIDSLLPERASGTTASTGRPGPPPRVGPLPQRIQIATKLIRESGGKMAQQVELRADRQGAVQLRMHLVPGCHRLLAMPTLRAGGRTRLSDTDMELRSPADEDVLVRDRSFATDAVIDVCVGEPQVYDVMIGGVPPLGEVTLLHGEWEIPDGIPTAWAPRARAAISHALQHRRSPTLTVEPSWEGLGASGTTVITIPIEPGACYLVGASAAAGDVRAVQVAARVGARLAADNGGGVVDAGVVSFCAGAERFARLEIDAIGSRVTWVAGAWKVARTPLGAEVLP